MKYDKKEEGMKTEVMREREGKKEKKKERKKVRKKERKKV